jgi:predicted amidophosphoribosyltransferase
MRECRRFYSKNYEIPSEILAYKIIYGVFLAFFERSCAICHSAQAVVTRHSRLCPNCFEPVLHVILA